MYLNEKGEEIFYDPRNSTYPDRLEKLKTEVREI